VAEPGLVNCHRNIIRLKKLTSMTIKVTEVLKDFKTYAENFNPVCTSGFQQIKGSKNPCKIL
jgi:hypothetical protein